MAKQVNERPEGDNLGHNSSFLETVEISGLRRKSGDPRRLKKSEIDRAKAFVARFKDRVLPIVVGANTEVLVDAVFVEAARILGLTHLRVIRQNGLDEREEQLYSIAATNMLTRGTWDGEALERAVRDFEREVEDFASDLLGFPSGELDALIGLSTPFDTGGSDAVDHKVSAVGSRWALDRHRLICGDSTDPETLALLTDNRPAAAAICDHPFGCKVDGFVSKRGKHRDFVQGAGELSNEELFIFFRKSCFALRSSLEAGALVYLFIDWRSLSILQKAAEEVFGGLINLCVWSKDRSGMGSLYRSRHELVLVFAVPGAKHRNNIELGRHGRDRSNVWEYPSAASSRSGREGDILKLHPTPKSVEMIADAIIDCTKRGEVVIDSFLGSGTTLIAAERTGRVCCAADLDPLYVDIAIRRWQRWTGRDAIDVATGLSFDELEARVLAGEA